MFEILNSNTNSTKIPSINSKLLLRLNFVRKPFLICWTRHIPLNFQNLNLIFSPFILHYKYPNNAYTPKTPYPRSLCEVESDFKFFHFFHFFLYTLYNVKWSDSDLSQIISHARLFMLISHVKNATQHCVLMLVLTLFSGNFCVMGKFFIK